MKAFTDNGPFADSSSHDTLEEMQEMDEARNSYHPFCPSQGEDEDGIVYSTEFGEYGGIDSEVLEALSGSVCWVSYKYLL